MNRISKQETINIIGNTNGFKESFYKEDHWKVVEKELLKLSIESLVYILEALGNVRC